MNDCQRTKKMMASLIIVVMAFIGSAVIVVTDDSDAYTTRTLYAEDLANISNTYVFESGTTIRIIPYTPNDDNEPWYVVSGTDIANPSTYEFILTAATNVVINTLDTGGNVIHQDNVTFGIAASSDLNNGPVSMTVPKGSSASYSWAEASTTMVLRPIGYDHPFYTHTFSIGVGTSQNVRDGSTYSGITINWSTSGIIISADSSVAVGTYYVAFYDFTTEDDIITMSFQVTNEASVPAQGSGTSANDPIKLNIRNGQSFVYQPFVNLSGSQIALDTNCSAYQYTVSDSNSFATYTTTFTGVTDGSKKVLHFTASWDNGQTGTYRLEQTAHQYIEFTVYNYPELVIENQHYTGTSNTKNLGCLTGEQTSVFPGLMVGTGNSPSSAQLSFGAFIYPSGGNQNLFSWTNTNGVATLSQNAVATAADVGTYSTSITITSAIPNLYTEKVTINVSITVAAGITIVAEPIYETYVGNTNSSQNTYVLNVTKGAQITNFSVTQSNNAPNGFFTWNGTTNTMTWNPSAAGIGADIAYDSTHQGTPYVDNSFTLRAQGDFNDGSTNRTVYDEKNITVRTYAQLKFMEGPSMSNITQTVSNSNPLEVNISTTVSGAKTITYDWGDGQMDVDTSNGDTQLKSRTHTYSQIGNYQITITAQNEKGTKSMTTLFYADESVLIPYYDIDDPTGTEPKAISIVDDKISMDNIYVPEGKKILNVYKDQQKKYPYDFSKPVSENWGEDENKVLFVEYGEKSLMDYHGWIFIVASIICILLIIVTVYFGMYIPSMFALIALSAIIAVAAFITNDFTAL